MTPHWTDKYTRSQLVAVVRVMARDGKSASQIAKEIGLGVTKNIIIGLVNTSRPRIQLQGRGGAVDKDGMPRPKKEPSPGKTAPNKVPRVAGKPLSFIILDEVATFDADPSLHISELEPKDGRCRFPLWPDRIGNLDRSPKQYELRYCGRPTIGDSSWCPDCRKKVYADPLPRPGMNLSQFRWRRG